MQRYILDLSSNASILKENISTFCPHTDLYFLFSQETQHVSNAAFGLGATLEWECILCVVFFWVFLDVGSSLSYQKEKKN